MKLNKGIIFITTGLLVSLLGATSCTHDNALPKTPYDKAESSTGGIMYDKFWAEEANFDQEDPNLDLFNDNPDFFRCKQCHAWDGLGNKGSYIGRRANATRPNVSSLDLYELAQDKTPEELFAALKESDGRRDLSYDLSQYDPATNNTEGDKMPDLSQILTDKEIWSLVKFLKEGMIDVTELYNGNYQGLYPSGIASYSEIGLNGDATAGNAYYADNCASCHGSDGLKINLDGLGVGGFTRAKPYEVQHKTKFGQLGSSMGGAFEITDEEMRNMYKALADESDFPKDFVLEVSYANDMQPFFDAKCIACHKTNATAPDLSIGVSYGVLISDSDKDGVAYVNTSTPESSSIYTWITTGTMSNYATAAEADMVLRWIQQGAQDN